MNLSHEYCHTADDHDWWRQQDDDSRSINEVIERHETMKFQAKSSANFAIAPEGNHVAICNAIVDLGIQAGSTQFPNPKHKIYMRFELPDESVEFTKDGHKVTGPMTIGKTMTASMHAKATLRKFVESWIGRKFSDDAAEEFRIETLLGRACLLNVTHSVNGDKTYADITAATPLPKSMSNEHEQHNPSLFFDLNQFDQQTFDRLPNWLQEKISARLDMPKVEAPADFTAEIPFD